MHNLRQGSLTLEADGEHYLDRPIGIQWPTQVRTLDGKGIPSGSGFLNFLSLPAYFIFDAVDAVVPIGLVLILAWSVMAYWSSRWVWEYLCHVRGRPRPRWTAPRPAEARLDRNPLELLWDWTGRMGRAHGIVFRLVVLVTLLNLWWYRTFPWETWGEALATQVTTAVVAASAVVAFHEILKRTVGKGWAADLGAGLLLLGTPLAFWGTQIKYHGVMLGLVIWGAYFILRGWSEKRVLLRAVGIALSGLAAWNHPSGLIFVAAMGVVEFLHAAWPLARRAGKWRPSWRPLIPRGKSHVVALVALLVGLTPYFAYNAALFGNPLLDFYNQGSDTAISDQEWQEKGTGVIDEKVDASKKRVEQRLEYQTDFQRSPGRGWNSISVYLYAGGAGEAPKVEGAATAVLVITPMLVAGVFAPAAYWQARRARKSIGPGATGAATPDADGSAALRWNAAATLFLAFAILHWYLYIQRGPFQGAGYDLRYFAVAVPAYLFFAMIGIKWAVRNVRATLRQAAITYAYGWLGLIVFLFILARANLLLEWTDELKQTYPLMNVLGITAYAMLPVVILGRPLLDPYYDRVLGTVVGIALLASSLWVFTVLAIFHTGIPPHEGYPGFNYILPAMEQFSKAALWTLYPPKWIV